MSWLIERLSVGKSARSFGSTHSVPQLNLHRALAPGVFLKKNTRALFIEIAWQGKEGIF